MSEKTLPGRSLLMEDHRFNPVIVREAGWYSMKEPFAAPRAIFA
jgi:hypothetical protein